MVEQVKSCSVRKSCHVLIHRIVHPPCITQYNHFIRGCGITSFVGMIRLSIFLVFFKNIAEVQPCCVRVHNSNSLHALPLRKLQWLLHHALHQLSWLVVVMVGVLHSTLTCADAGTDLCILWFQQKQVAEAYQPKEWLLTLQTRGILYTEAQCEAKWWMAAITGKYYTHRSMLV